MAQVVYVPFPSVEPRAQPPGDYQNIPTRPQEFGAQVGQGEEQLGAGATKAGQFYGEVAADDATNKWEEETNTLLYGDPNTPGDRGYYGLVGEDAMKAMPGVRAKINTLRDQYRQGLYTPASQLQFDQYTRRSQHFLNGEIGRHYDQQFTSYATATNKAAADLALHGVSGHATDQDAVNNFTGNLMQSYIREAQNKYGANPSPDIINDAMARARSDSVTQQVRALARTDPAHAADVLKNNSDALSGPGLDQLTRELKGPMDDAVANSALQRARSGGAGTAPHGTAGPATNRQEVIDFWKGKGFTEAQAGGIADNVGRESSFRPDASGDGGSSFGLYQHHADRLAALQQQPNYKTATAQNEFAWHELNTTEKGALTAIKAATTEQEAEQAWRTAFERPSAGQGNSLRLAANTPGPHAPGVADIADAQANLATNFGNTIASLNNDPALDANLDAKAKAIQKAELDYRSHEMILNGQAKALTEGRNIAADGYVQRMMKGPIDGGILSEIANDTSLDRETRENLWHAYDAHVKSSVGGDTIKYGPRFFEYYQRIHADDNDPNKIRDPSQIYALANPKADGSQDVTLAGVEKLTAALKAPTVAKVGQQKIQAGAMAYAKHQLSFEADYGVYKVRDPKGEDAFNIGFIPAFFDYWEKGLEANKTPQQLVAKDEINKLIAPFKRSDADLMKDQLEAGSEAPSANPAKPVAPVKPEDLPKMDQAGLIAAVRANPALRSQAEAIAIQKGWIQAPVAPPIAH